MPVATRTNGPGLRTDSAIRAPNRGRLHCWRTALLDVAGTLWPDNLMVHVSAERA
jgi:hypothetical protein